MGIGVDDPIRLFESDFHLGKGPRVPLLLPGHLAAMLADFRLTRAF